MSNASIVEVENLCFSYPPLRRGASNRPALSDVSFSVEEGEIFGLLGPNGGGMTTLFKILSTLMLPTSGRAFFLQRDIRGSAHDFRHEIGVAFQFPCFDK